MTPYRTVSFTVLLAALSFGPPWLFAQTPSTVVGVVQDESGSVLPGAAVTLRLAGRPLATTTTNGAGLFRFRAVEASSVEIAVEMPGFRPADVTLDVRPGAVTTAPPIVLPIAPLTDQITVTANRDERRVGELPSAIGVVGRPAIEAARAVNLTELLDDVPGVYAGNVSGVDDLRISIRGSGVRANFGSRGVLLMADGVPVTEPDGQTPHFDGQIDLADADRVEVVKGPASAVYGGAAIGGVVNVISRPPSGDLRVGLSAEAGSYAFAKAHGSASGPLGPVLASGSFGYTNIDGFRAHNSLRDWAGSGRAYWAPGAGQVTLSLLGTDAALELPGTLDRAQFEADPSQTRSIYVANDWGRQNTLFRFGARYDLAIGTSHAFELDSFGQTRDLFHPIFVVIDQDARRYMGHGRYRFTRGRQALVAGVDFDRQWVDDRWFVNAGGQPGFQIRNDENTITNMGVYVQDEWRAGPGTTVTAGVRYDRIRYDLSDLILFDGNASDVRAFERVSPKVGVSNRVGERWSVYGNVSTGFETPTLGEVRLPAGFNGEVDPQRAVSIEGGVRGQAGRADVDVSVFRMVVKDEILPETLNNVTVYRNVAEATHSGLEAAATYRPVPRVTLDAAYTWAHYVLSDFGRFSGNRLPGVPGHFGTARLSVAPQPRVEIGASLRWATATFLNDANSEEADGYGVVGLTAGYRLGPSRLFVRVDNVGNVLYTDRVQVNDNGGFFFYPAQGRNASVGMQLRW
jgi:iron complex outermembrane receptor protein